MKALRYLWIMAFGVIILYGCDPDANRVHPVSATTGDETTTYRIRMTDDPINFQQVNIDIRLVQINMDDQWLDLNTNSGIYNLLEFESSDTLLGSGTIMTGNVKEIRLVLGDDNSVMINGDLFPLETPSAQQSGLKIKVNQNLIANRPWLTLIDFDASESIILTGNDKFILRPVIRVLYEGFEDEAPAIAPWEPLTVEEAPKDEVPPLLHTWDEESPTGDDVPGFIEHNDSVGERFVTDNVPGWR